MNIQIDQVRFIKVRVTPKTAWYFAKVMNSNGLETVVEFTKGSSSGEVAKLIHQMTGYLSEQLVEDESDVESILNIDHIMDGRSVESAAISAVRTAITQLLAMEKDISLNETFGGGKIEKVPLYANINRGLFSTDRKPNDFAAAAENAVKRGFSTIKCAPFDEVSPSDSSEWILKSAEMGIERVKSIRRAVGESITVLIDCHSRFTPETASQVAEKLESVSIGWFEEPLSPNDHSRSLSDVVKKVSMPVAGGESGYGEPFFDALLSSGSLEIVMPDIKYCGGVSESVRIGRLARSKGAGVSLHSPSGPVSLLASAHSTAAVECSMALEHAVSESDWRSELIEPAEVIRDGNIYLPKGPGLGAVLNSNMMAKRGEYFSV